MLARKDFQTRYKRASFGVLWVVALPVLQASVMAIVFSRVARFDVNGSYTAFVMGGTFAWAYLSGTAAVVVAAWTSSTTPVAGLRSSQPAQRPSSSAG